MSNLRSFIVVILLVTLVESGPHQNRQIRSTDDVDYRLPSNILPTRYFIYLKPNIELGHFHGESSINISVTTNDTRTITLHAKNLVVNETFTYLVNRKTNNRVKPMNQSMDNVKEFLILDFFGTPFDAGEYTLNLQYTGQLNNESKGFYRISYTKETGQKTWLAATQFTPIHAREAFPCFDEPAMKAKFEISILHFNNYSAISNMPEFNVTRDEKDSLKYRTTFKVTPIMSTYAIAFVISDLINATSDDKRFSLWSRRSQIHKSNYALGIGQSALELLEDYTVFDNPVPKMDIVAIPRLNINSTNNWGLVSSGENELAYEESVTTASDKQDIAMTISRQIAHQWFGNLMSPLWWDDAWLNEGFAEYFQYYITDEAETNWRMMDQFVVTNLQEKAFFADDTGVQRPLNFEIKSPEDIRRNFDAITSNKAACIIRMLHHALGPEKFRSALKAYIRNQAYGVGRPQNLGNALANTTAFPDYVATDFDPWVNQKGYPLLTVNHVHGEHYRITQSRYLPKRMNNENSTELWSIPIQTLAQDEPELRNFTAWFSDKVNDWDTWPDGKWVIFNSHQTGYYRVNYDDDNWNRLTNCLNSENYTQIPVLSRAQLLDDSFQLAQSGYHNDHMKFLNISRYLQQEVDCIPWYAAFRAFSYLNKALMNTENYQLFKLYMLRLIGKLEAIVGYNEMADDEHVTKLNRMKVIDWACKMGSVNCTTAVHKMFMQHLNGARKISADLQSAIMCAGIRKANTTIWNRTFRLYEESKDSNERRAILKALGCSPDRKILKSYLRKAMDPTSEISLGLVIEVIAEENERGPSIAADFIKNNFATIIGTVADKESVLQWSHYIGTRMFTGDQTDKLEKLSNSLLLDYKDLADTLRANAIASAMSNVKWIETHEGAISSFLRDQDLVDK